MNIKITIRDADSSPLMVNHNQRSELEKEKKKSLYQKPTHDKEPNKRQQPTPKRSREDKSLRQTGYRMSRENEEGYKEVEKKMMQDLDQISKNQADLDMIHNSNNILQRQNEILEHNQKTIHSMVKNQQGRHKGSTTQSNASSKEIEGLLAQVKGEVNEMKKIKEEIARAGQEVSKMIQEAGRGAKRAEIQQVNQGMNNIQGNLQHLSQISKNHLAGLENLEGIKSLQNFNIEAYSQAINTLKRQIVQYQKESEDIERELKLRYAKLEKLQVQPHFDDKILEPYQDYLRRKAQSIDLHAIKEQVYDKLGHFDYGKFEYDVSEIMSQVKGQMNEFGIVCKQYRIEAPAMSVNPKDIKGLGLNLRSALDEYKTERGIDFSSKNENNSKAGNELADSRKKMRRTGEAIMSREDQKKHKAKVPRAIRELNTKQVDMTQQVRLNKGQDNHPKTVLETKKEKERKEVKKNMRKAQTKEEVDFDRYLEYRSREELELLYKEKEERLKRQMHDLYTEANKQEPQVHLSLNLTNQVRREQSPQGRKQPEPRAQEDKKPEMPKIQPKQQREEEQYQQLKPIGGLEGQKIKQIGTEVLREKLKNLMGPQLRQNEQVRPPAPAHSSAQQPNLHTAAEGLIGLINKTLTQVNTQLSQTITQKVEQRSQSKEKREQRRSPHKMDIPKLAEFTPPPPMPAFYPPSAPVHFQPQPQPNPSIASNNLSRQASKEKIVPKKYENLKITESYGKEQLQISDDYSEDFES